MLIADRVLPIESGDRASELDVMEEAAMDLRDNEDEVVVDGTREESLSTELVDA